TKFGHEHLGRPFLFESQKANSDYGRGYFTSTATSNIEFVVPNMTLAQFEAIKDFGQYASLRAISLLKEEKNKDDWLVVSQILWSNTRKHWEAVAKEIAGTYDTTIQRMFLGPGSRYIPREKFLELIKSGCAFCNDPLS